MKKSKKFKFLVVALVFITFFMSVVGVVNANQEDEYVKATNQYEFSPRELTGEYSINSTGGTKKYSFPYSVTKEMVKDKTAVALITDSGFKDSVIDTSDASNLLVLTELHNGVESTVIDSIFSDLSNALEIKEEDIELRATFYDPADKNNSIVLSSKTSTKKDTEQVTQVLEYVEGQRPILVKEGKLSKGEVVVRLDAIMPDGSVYTLVLAGENYEFNNWFMVRTKDAPKEEPPVENPPVEEPAKQFKTDLSYTAIVDGKVVDGTLKDGTYYPNYDRTKVEKDAKVTAKITSTTKTDIVKINGVDLNPDGTKNSLGWYYADKSDKTVIVKDYPFENVDNIEDNGIVIEKDLELTSIDGLKDKQTVSIEWPFRIIDLTQKPEKIDDKTEKVTVIITTNLPMEEEKLPDGWKFTEDEEGKTQHRIYKEFYKKDGNKEEDVVVIANNRDDKDNTSVKVEWPEKQQEEPKKEEPKEELPEKIPQTGKNFGLVIAIISLAGVSVVSYRKLRK